jgi:hypothetical protein
LQVEAARRYVGMHMTEQTIYITARGEQPLAAPTDIVRMHMQRCPYVMSVESAAWHERALMMTVRVNADSMVVARGIVESAIAQATTSVWRQFVVTAEKLLETPALL